MEETQEHLFFYPRTMFHTCLQGCMFRCSVLPSIEHCSFFEDNYLEKRDKTPTWTYCLNPIALLQLFEEDSLLATVVSLHWLEIHQVEEGVTQNSLELV